MAVMESPKRLVNSRRLKKLLPWVSALVLIAGIVAVIVAYSTNGSGSQATPNERVGPANPPIPSGQVPSKNIVFPEAAWKVAQEFAFTALARKNLARSYEISDSTVRSGYTLKQWKTGTLPNLPYFPTAKLIKYNWKNTNFVHAREAQINVVMIPTKASKQQPITAQIALKKFGQGANAHWLVDYFSPVNGPRVPTPK
jgi:hypothetical protein